MKNYTGFPQSYKITTLTGEVHIMRMMPNDDYIDNHCAKIQQFTGAVDRKGNKVYFGDTLRFMDKVVYYAGNYKAKVNFGIMTREQALAEIDLLPYHEIVVDADFELSYLESSDMKNYFEVVNTNPDAER